RHRNLSRGKRHDFVAIRPQARLGRPAFGDRLEPAADLVWRSAEVVEAWQRGEALETEDALEERRRPIADGSAIVAAGLGDEAALDEPRDDGVSGDAAH